MCCGVSVPEFGGRGAERLLLMKEGFGWCWIIEKFNFVGDVGEGDAEMVFFLTYMHMRSMAVCSKLAVADGRRFGRGQGGRRGGSTPPPFLASFGEFF